MVWFKIDDALAFHPKVVAAGNAAMGLWVRAGSYCAAHLTDGFVPRGLLTPLGGRLRDAEKLVDAGLWVTGFADVPPESCQNPATEPPKNRHRMATRAAELRSHNPAKHEGWWFRDWNDFQPTKAQVEAERAATAERVREFRKNKRNAVGNAVTPPVTNGGGTAAPTRPDPTLKKRERTASGDDAAKSVATIEHQVADAAYQKVGKAFNFIAVRGIAKWALHDRGEQAARVEAALVGVHELGKPITKQTVGQWLDGTLGSPQERRQAQAVDAATRRWQAAERASGK